jgi:hypothetical protein
VGYGWLWPCAGVEPHPKVAIIIQSTYLQLNFGYIIMTNIKRLIGVTALIILCGLWKVQAEDLDLSGTTVRNSAQCLSVLSEFTTICEAFEIPEWAEQYGKPFWASGGQLIVYMYDLDTDGKSDFIITIGGALPRCSRGSSGCEHIFLFGGAPVEKAPRRMAISMWGTPVLKFEGSKIEIYFTGSKGTVLTVEDVKKRMKNGSLIKP